MNMLLSLFIVIITVSLWSLGESRIDAYIALYTLAYVVLISIIRPKRISRDYLLITLLIAFSIAVGYRIYEVLWG